ncbi:hypothetical protein ON010_g8270 [Phytophthora cinnamomi]|nr:hypothetical protein ON010_g8270 [Phytophthora cinnamomi]
MEDDGDVAHVVDLFLKDMDALERQQGIQSRQQTCNAGRPQVKTCGQRRIPTWLRTKRELQALRQQSEEMETRAVFLKSQQDKRCRQLGITPGRLDKLHQSKLIADREKQLQREAEEKNEALKRQLQACARVSSVLKKTITALSVQREEILDGVVPMRTSIVATDMGVQRHLTISSFNTFKILEDQVDERFHSFQPLLEEIRQASLTLDEEHVQTCGGEEDAISAMEYKCTRLLPFDAKVTRKAAWSIIEEGGGPQKQVSNVMRRSEDVHAVDSRFALPLGQGTIVAIDRLARSGQPATEYQFCGAASLASPFGAYFVIFLSLQTLSALLAVRSAQKRGVKPCKSPVQAAVPQTKPHSAPTKTLSPLSPSS